MSPPPGTRPDPPGSLPRFQYSLVKGVFAQDEEDFVPTADQIQPKLGLIADKWPDVDEMNRTAPEGTYYKLIIAGRHGQGYHNVAIAKYTSDEWRNQYAMQNGNGWITWGPDPKLTPLGIEQAESARGAWLKYRPPAPEAFYCSPHRRAIKTCQIAFPNREVIVLEEIREKLSGHTCDFRLSVSYLKSKFPRFDFSAIEHDSDPFAPQHTVLADPHSKEGIVRWMTTPRTPTENEARVADRVSRVLDFLFEYEKAGVVSITAHAGWIRGLFDATGRYRYQLQTGGMSPFLIKAIRVRDGPRDEERDARDTKTTLGLEAIASSKTTTVTPITNGKVPEAHRTNYF